MLYRTVNVQNISKRKRTDKEREQLLETLTTEQGLLQTVVQQLPAGVIIAEAPSGKLIFGNEQVEQIWRHPFLPSAEVEEYKQWQGFHPDGQPYKPEEWPLARSLRRGEVVTNEEIQYVRGDGILGIMNVSSTPIRDSSGCIVAGVVTFYEITEQKQAEKALQKWAHIFEFAEWGIAIDRDDGKTLEMINPAFATMHGYTVEEMIGMPILDLFAPEYREALAEYIRIVDEQGYISVESKHRRKDGTIFPVLIDVTAVKDGDGNLLYRAVNVRDITVRKQAEEQIQQLNATLEQQVQERTAQLQQALGFEAVLKRITDKVRDSLDESQILQTAVRELGLALNLSRCNAGIYNLERGTTTIAYEYTPLMSVFQKRELQMALFPEIYQLLLQGQSCQFCSIVFNPIQEQGTLLACPVFDDQGVLGDLWLLYHQPDYVFNKQEIRLIKQVANQCAIAIRQARLYQAAQAQVKELEKLNHLKDDFLSTVSHELRTPMANMKMAIQMLKIAPTLERGQRYLDILQTECNREIELINDLLDLQRLEADSYPIFLADAIQLQEWLPKILESFHTRTQERQQILQVEIPAELPPLVSNLASLERILAELLNNACKYTPAGERITVTAEAKSGRMRLRIRNSGVEIPSPELARIFDKFYRIPSADRWKQGGTGLGLALVQKLTKHLGGVLQVESTAQETTFTVDLPNTTAVTSSWELLLI